MFMLELFGDWQDQIEYAKGDLIFQERDPADAMYVVIEGEVELFKGDEPLGAERAGGIVGEMALISNSIRSATARVIEPSRLARISRDQFRDVIVKNPDAALHVMAVLANRLKVANMLLHG